MRKWLQQISGKYKEENQEAHPISKIDAQIIEQLISVLSMKECDDVVSILAEYKRIPDDDILMDIKTLISEIESDPETPKPKIILDINGVKIPLKYVRTIKECVEYNYDTCESLYSIMLNEANINTDTYSNIVIRCASEEHMNGVMESVELMMSDYRHKFVKI